MLNISSYIIHKYRCRVKDHKEIVAVYLFGSYAEKKDRPFSDIDIGIIAEFAFIDGVKHKMDKFESFENLLPPLILRKMSNFSKKRGAISEILDRNSRFLAIFSDQMTSMELILRCTTRKLLSGRTYPPYTVANRRIFSPFEIL